MDSPALYLVLGFSQLQLTKEEQSRQGKGKNLQPGPQDKSLGVWQEAALPIPGLYFSISCFNSHKRLPMPKQNMTLIQIK